MATQRTTPLVGIARAGLTVAVALGLTSVFRDRAWLVAAAVAAVAPHAVIAAGERRRFRALATFTLLIAGALVLTMYVVEPHTLSNGLPTRETFRLYFDDLAHAPEILRSAVVPVEAQGGALMLALLACWVAGAVAEWSARRLDASLGALGPSLVLFVAVAALGDGSWVPVTMGYALAASGYLLVLHQSEATERRSWFHAPRPHRSRTMPGGVAGGIAVVCAAVLLGPLLPGARSNAWFDYRSLGEGDGGGILKATTPIVSIQAKLLSDPEREVFRVRVDDATQTYWRVIALDEYNGELWTLLDTGKNADELRPVREPAEHTELVQEYEILESDAHWLPAAYQPERISLDDALVVPESSTLYLKQDESIRDLRYEVTSAVPVVDKVELRAADTAVDDKAHDRYLELPDEFPTRIRDTAQGIIDEAGATTPYAQAEALQGWLNDPTKGGFRYNQEVARNHDLDNLEQFLFELKEGYCEQFASAFAAMARSIGLPTRIAVGYTAGDPIAEGMWSVKNKHAHAWPEVYFAGYGWLPLEPTPGRYEPVLGNGSPGTGPAQIPGEETTTGSPGSIATTTPTTIATPPPTRPVEESTGALQLGQESRENDAPVRRFFVGIAYVAATVAALTMLAVGALATLVWRRTRRRRLAADPRQRVLGAWAQALDHLEEAGIERKPSATPVEFALRHAPAYGAGDAGPPLMELAQLQTEALFAREAPSPDAADTAWEHVDTIDSALRRMISRTVRWRRRLDPRRVREPVDV
ncbi:MAG: transglutaminase TgpA family protein [Actinomycetota bacterium]